MIYLYKFRIAIGICLYGFLKNNLDLIKTADHIIDLGHEGGDGGGEIVAEGTPEEIMKNKNSYALDKCLIFI